MAKRFRKTFFIGGKAVEAEVEVEEITVYDRAGNKIFRDFNGGPEDTMEYDARGNPVHGRNDWGEEVWMEYDGSGRLVHVRGAVDPFASADYEQWYEYDDAGRLIRVWSFYGGALVRTARRAFPQEYDMPRQAFAAVFGFGSGPRRGSCHAR